MRLAVCALSAVLLSGCSWLGGGSHHDDSYGYQYGYGGAYGAGGAAGCAPGYGYTGYGQAGGAGGCAPGAGYSVAQNGYMGGAGATGMYGAGAGAGGMYGAGSGAGATGMYGAGGASGMYGMGGMAGAGGMYGMGSSAYGSTTTLTSAAPYGAAVGSGVTAGGVQTVQGSPIYVAQPYPSYYGVPVLRGYSHSGGGYGYGYGGGGGYGYGGAMPFGIELGGGSEFDVGGDLFQGKAASPNNEDFALATGEVVSPAVSYDTAFKQGYNFGGGVGYDVGPSTTVLGMVNYQKNEGNTFENGTFQPGSYDALGNFTASGPAETVTAEMSDLEQITLEGGVRQYMGGATGFRPYVGAMGGFTHNNAVDLTQSSTTLGTFTQNYIESGWTPTAAGLVGAEMAVGPRAAIGVETGIRWRDSLDTNNPSDSRWSVPVSLRGRVAF